MHYLGTWFFKITAWIFSLFIFRKKVYYEDKLTQNRHIRGKAIVITNHNNILDFGFMEFLFFDRVLRCQVAELMYKKNFFMTFFLKMLGSIKVDRDRRDFSFMKKSVEVLDKGGVLMVYPEARIPKDHEEKPLPFKSSVTQIAFDSGAPIIPVYCDGKYMGKGPCSVIIGKPINVKDMYDESLTERENRATITIKLREKIIQLKDELNRQKEEKAK